MAGRYKTDKPVAKNAIKPKKTGFVRKTEENKNKTEAEGRGAAVEPKKSMGLWTRMANYFMEVCEESFILFILKPQELSKPAPKPQPQGQPPRGFALRLKWPGGSIEIEIRGGGTGGERATGAVLLCCSGCPLPCFLLASGRRRQTQTPKNRKTDRQKKRKKERLASPCSMGTEMAGLELAGQRLLLIW
jgi:hypothetical protein